MPKARKPPGDDSPLQSNPFAQLGSLAVPDGPAEAAESPATAPAPDLNHPFSGKLVLRRQRKGHGGKTMTYIEGIAAPESELRAIAKRLRKLLGCGGHVEGGCVVLGGVQSERVAQWLREQGARNVVVGN